MYGLTPYSSVAEVEKTLREQGYRLRGVDGGYARDEDFKDFVFENITTVEQALEIADRLDFEHANEFLGGKCSKARSLRYMFKESKFWRNHPAIALSQVRRTCCITHETGSFAINER